MAKKFSCDFVQAPKIGNPNYGDCLSTSTELTPEEAVSVAAEEAKKYAKPGKIHAILYSGETTFGEVTCDSVDQAQAAIMNLPDPLLS